MTFAQAKSLDLPPPELPVTHDGETWQIATKRSERYQEQEMPIPPTIKDVTNYHYKEVL